MIENYNEFYIKVLKEYDYIIKRRVFSLSQDYDERKDLEQEVRFFLYNRLKAYEKDKPLDFFIKDTIKHGILKVIYKTNQNKFENSFHSLEEVELSDFTNIDESEKLIEKITNKLCFRHKLIFYSLIYNIDNKNYKELSDILHMKYCTFLGGLRKIRLVAKDIWLK